MFGILFFNVVYLHKYHDTHTEREREYESEWERVRETQDTTSTRSEFEFYRMEFIPLLFHVIYKTYYKLTRGKKIYFCVALRARLLLFDGGVFFVSFSLFFVCQYISLASCKAVHAHTHTHHVETFSISTKRFISSYILFTRWHSQFVSIGLHTDHKVLHTQLFAVRMYVCVCMHSSFSILFRYCFLFALFACRPLISLFHWNFRFRKGILFALHVIHATPLPLPYMQHGICACVLIKWPQKSLLIKLKNCESLLLLHLNYSTDVFYMRTTLYSKGYEFDRIAQKWGYGFRFSFFLWLPIDKGRNKFK